MKADRALVDTNVLISALLTAGPPRQVLDQLAANNATLLFSDATFAELATRLVQPKFEPYLTRATIESYLDWLVQVAEWVTPTVEIEACRDPDDDKFLSVAVHAEADCLITGDDDLLVLHPFQGVPILSPRQILKLAK